MNMKPYLSLFLLFLLLNQFLSGTAAPSLLKILKGATADPSGALGEAIRKVNKHGKKIIDFADILKDNAKKALAPPPKASRPLPNAPPPPPNKPLKKTNGLHIIKDYLSNYGYIKSSGPFNDYWDQETISAFESYQQFFNQEVTGNLSRQTANLMSLPRCGVPDINFSYNLTGNVSWPKAGNKWFPDGNLTYGFLPASDIPDNMTKVFRDSFTRWSQASKALNLTETTYDNADIKIGAYNLTFLGLGFEEQVYGTSLIVLQPPSNVTKGFMLLDPTNMLWALPSENETLSWKDGILDLETMAMHEIGHLLGLDHSSMPDSVMHPYILPSQQRKVQLSDSDKKNIQQQYSKGNSDIQKQNANGNSGHCGRWGMLSLTTVSLGFAYVLLF